MLTTQRAESCALRAPRTVAPNTARRRTSNQELRALVADVLRPGEDPEAFIRAAVRSKVRRRLEDKAVAVAMEVLHGAPVDHAQR